ncbi:hypothetical protein [Neobacillus vireti]|uniref:hypothetical protein n=1 Tax=Neobacillus vireti TaxID=220686 RepID=UPI002FFFA56D
MKKTHYIMLAALLLLAACNTEEKNKNQSTNEQVKENVEENPKEDTEEKPDESKEVPTKEDTEEKLNEQSQENQPQETPQPITADQVKEIINYIGVGEGDQLSNVSFVNGEIKATIALAPNEMVPAKDMAVNRYSQLSDELLNHEGWDILTIVYPSIGTISMNRNEKETNGFGDYFPTMVIEEKLK